MPQVFRWAVSRFVLLLVAVTMLNGCASDKECWQPDFSERPSHDKTEKKK